MGRGNVRGGSLVYVDEGSVRKMQDLGKALRSANNGKALRKQLNAEIREAAKPLVYELGREARWLDFQRTSRAGASRARRTGRTLKSGKFKTGKGLRESIATGIRTQVSYGANSAGVRVRMASKDPDVNRLARVLDRKGTIRHPLFGNRDSWHETRSTNGRGWWTSKADEMLPLVRRRVGRVLDTWTGDLAKRIDRAA